jgi:protein arginine kinase
MSLNPNLTASLIGNPPYSAVSPSIWMASTITLKRNFSHFHFPSKMTEGEKNETSHLLKEALLALQKDLPLAFFDEASLSPLDKELIYEHFLFLRGFQQNFSGGGLLIDQKGRFLALLDSTNHLELRMVISDASFEKSWEVLTFVEGEIGKRSPFAFSSKFGYLTSDPTQCGTGLLVQAYLHLPALIQMKQLAKFLPKEEEELTALGLGGSTEELTGDWMILKNAYTLGVTEEAILQSIQTASTKFVSAEKALRSKLKETGDPVIKDLISKSYGLLLHSYKLEITEALDYLSLIKLGIDLGWVTGVSDQKINDLFFKCRRGHLAHLFPELASQNKELEHKRAEFLHKELQGLQLAPALT